MALVLKERRDLVAATLVLLGSRLATLPRSLWEFDEPLFIEAVWRYEPLHHHPPPPGYPVFIALGKLLNFFFHDPLTSLVVLSLIGSVLGFVTLALAAERLSGDRRIGIAAALIFYFSPVMMVHSVLPISDPIALGLLALTLYAMTRLLGYGASLPSSGDALLFGAAAALTIGCRPQFSLALMPMLIWVLAVAPSWRLRSIALSSFGTVCLLWFVPLVLAAGGIERWWLWLGEQASYFARHDAAISRGGRPWIQVGLRFIAHPWGPKWLSIPLLLVAAAGLIPVFRFRSRGAIAFLLMSGPYLLFCLLMMDPADGPRYALPALPFIAFLAASRWGRAAGRWPLAAYVLILAFAGSSLLYTSTFMAERGRSASPPVQAARHAYRTIPRNSVILYELPLWPHAKYLFKNYTTMRIDEGLHMFSARPEVAVFLYADGEAGNPSGATFRWIENDAYGKLTRNHYRVVSFIPIPPGERYRPLRGIHPSERTVIGEQWRWLEQEAELELPALGRKHVVITLGTPRHYPIASNSVEILINGSPVRQVTLGPDKSVDVVVDLPAGQPIVGVRAAKSFIPAQLPNSLDRDPRRLSVQLLRIRQLD